MNCDPSDQLPPQAAFLNLNWDQSMDSALSSIVTSPAASNSAAAENLTLHNLIAADDISPQSHYMSSTPLSSPPKLNLSIMASQFHHQYPSSHNGMPILENLMPMTHHLDQLLADPAFTGRAARLPCFDGQSYAAAIPAQQFGLPDNTIDESSVSNPLSVTAEMSLKAPQTESNAKKRKAVAKGKGKESSTTKDPNKEENAKRCKSAESNGAEKAEQNGIVSIDTNNGSKKQSGGGGGGNDSSSKPPEAPKDYIHVRARRGEATDSHSLAERVRREKITQRMKLLQDLVPGCNKVVGKAIMLDEIINYVQSLQRQVEFLSMKLATVNPQLDFDNLPNILPKDMQQSCNSLLNSPFPLETSGTYINQPHQGNPMNCSVTNGMEDQSLMHPLDHALFRSMGGAHHPFLNGVSDAASQVGTFWQDDLQSVVQMDIGQNPEIATSSQSFNGSLQAVHMKMEL